MNTQISQEAWSQACTNMSQASSQTVETFGCMIENIIYPVGSNEWVESLKRIVEYVASPKFREEEGI